MCNFIAGAVCQTTKNSFFSVLLFISTDNGRTRRAISSLLVCVTIRIRKGHTDFIQVSSRIFGSKYYLLRTSFEIIKPGPQKSRSQNFKEQGKTKCSETIHFKEDQPTQKSPVGGD